MSNLSPRIVNNCRMFSCNETHESASDFGYLSTADESKTHETQAINEEKQFTRLAF